MSPTCELLCRRSYRWLSKCPSIRPRSFKSCPSSPRKHSIFTLTHFSTQANPISIKMSNPRVFFDVSIGGQPSGRIVMELFKDKVPKVSTPPSESSPELSCVGPASSCELPANHH